MNWAARMADSHNVHVLLNRRSVSMQNVAHHFVDWSSEDEVTALMRHIRPDYLVNTIASTDVDNCEIDRKSAIGANILVASKIARITNNVGTKLIHISTDQLFQGRKTTFSEADAPDPMNFYGLTKQIGEDEVAKGNPGSLIVRTNFFGWGPCYRPSFSDWIISNVTSKKITYLRKDIYFTPIYIGDLVDILDKLDSCNACGVYNLVGNTKISKYEFGRVLCEALGYDCDLIQPKIELESQKTSSSVARRPVNMALSNAKLGQMICTSALTLTKMLHKMRKEKGYLQDRFMMR